MTHSHSRPLSPLRACRLAAMVATLALLTACETERTLSDGVTRAQCVGINQPKDTLFNYEYSTRNIVLGVLFVEIIVPPVMVVLNDLECPVSRKVPRA